MEGRYSRITSGERVKIEEMINEGTSLKAIAQALDKSATSISREVFRNRIKLGPVAKSKFMRNPCKKRKECKKGGLCKRKWCKKPCAKCEFIFCHEKCDEFVLWHCEETSRWPYVCNRCRWYSTCPEQRYSYKGTRADRIATSRASLSRKGLAIDKTEAARISAIVTPLLKKRQSPYHIFQHHKSELGCSLTTFYAYINAGLFDASRMDLVRAVKFKPRKKRRSTKDRRDLAGRTYHDYLVMMEACDDDEL